MAWIALSALSQNLSPRDLDFSFWLPLSAKSLGASWHEAVFEDFLLSGSRFPHICIL